MYIKLRYRNSKDDDVCVYLIKHHKGIPQCTTRILLSLSGLRIITRENAVRFNRLEFHTNKKTH